MTKQKKSQWIKLNSRASFKVATLVWPQSVCNSQGRYQKLAEMGTEKASPAAKGQECGLSAHIVFVEDVIRGDYLQKSTLWDRSFQPTSRLLKVSSQFSSVQFSHSVMSDSLRPHEWQHARPPCPLPTPGVHSDSRPSSRWCHPATSYSVVPFSSCPLSLPASQSFPMSQLFEWGGQSTGVSASASFLPKNTFRMDWLDLLAVQGTLKSLLQHHSSKASILQCSAFFTVQLLHPYMTTGKTIALTRRTFVLLQSK